MIADEPDVADPPAVDPRSAAADEHTVASLYRSHAVRLIRTALLLVGDQASAEDVVQGAFLGLQHGLARLNDPAKAGAYLRVSVLNGCRSVLRARRRARSGRIVHEPPVWSAESAALAGEERRELLRAISALPRRQREVLVLRYYLNLTDQEIAADLGISRGTVVSTASRALAALGRQLGDES